jgi:hypothetical protein
MKSIAGFKKDSNAAIKGAWVTLGIPFDYPMINEMIQGIIDVEGLIISTLLVMKQDRMSTDLPAWLNLFSGLINHQKLKTIFRSMPQDRRRDIRKNLEHAFFHDVPKSIKKIFDQEERAADVISETIHMRMQKLSTVEHVARSSLMIRNRLLYGTGFRADLITLTHIKGILMKGTHLAKLLCTNDSTISRILKDLRACGFLDDENERTEDIESFPGIFISTQTVWNLCEIIDASKFSHEELKQSALENLHLKHDGFGRKMLQESR